jgi:hypothetical protein
MEAWTQKFEWTVLVIYDPRGKLELLRNYLVHKGPKGQSCGFINTVV